VAIFLGKDLLAKLGFGDQSEERLTVNSGQEISEQGRPTYSLEYKLTKRWSLVGEYDRFNAFNAGLKWRVYSK
jgi:translocation and assembly module TamB